MPTFKHPCPYCGKFIDGSAVACPFCGVTEPFTHGRCPDCRASFSRAGSPARSAVARSRPITAIDAAASERCAGVRALVRLGSRPLRSPRRHRRLPLRARRPQRVRRPGRAPAAAPHCRPGRGSARSAERSSAERFVRPAPRRPGSAKRPACRSCRRSGCRARGRRRSSCTWRRPTGVPQFEQNFSEPTGLPQFVQTVVRVEMSPVNWVDAAICCCIWLICGLGARGLHLRRELRGAVDAQAALLVPARLVDPQVVPRTALEVVHELVGGLLEGLVARAAVGDLLGLVGDR